MPLKILAIDDSKTMRLAIKITFAAEQAEVVAVSKGGDAVARAKHLSPDVLLVDANLGAGEPGGAEVCRALKADPDTRPIPVILMVASRAGDAAGLAASCGADDVLERPFETADLIDRVRALVARRAGTGPEAEPVGMTSRAPAAAVQPGVAARPAVRPTAPTRPPVAVPPASPAAPRAPSSVSGGAPAASLRSTSTVPPVAAAGASGSVGGGTATGDAGAAAIPVVMPIPFTAADAPMSGMVERLRAAARGPGGEGTLDARTAEALLGLSRDVIEQVVWEVVPDLAEKLIREAQARSS